MNSLARITF